MSKLSVQRRVQRLEAAVTEATQREQAAQKRRTARLAFEQAQQTKMEKQALEERRGNGWKRGEKAMEEERRRIRVP